MRIFECKNGAPEDCSYSEVYYPQRYKEKIPDWASDWFDQFDILNDWRKTEPDFDNELSEDWGVLDEVITMLHDLQAKYAAEKDGDKKAAWAEEIANVFFGAVWPTDRKLAEMIETLEGSRHATHYIFLDDDAIDYFDENYDLDDRDDFYKIVPDGEEEWEELDLENGRVLKRIQDFYEANHKGDL